MKFFPRIKACLSFSIQKNKQSSPRGTEETTDDFSTEESESQQKRLTIFEFKFKVSKIDTEQEIFSLRFNLSDSFLIPDSLFTRQGENQFWRYLIFSQIEKKMIVLIVICVGKGLCSVGLVHLDANKKHRTTERILFREESYTINADAERLFSIQNK